MVNARLRHLTCRSGNLVKVWVYVEERVTWFPMWGVLENTDTGSGETRQEAVVQCLRDCLNKMTVSSKKEIYFNK